MAGRKGGVKDQEYYAQLEQTKGERQSATAHMHCPPDDIKLYKAPNRGGSESEAAILKAQAKERQQEVQDTVTGQGDLACVDNTETETQNRFQNFLQNFRQGHAAKYRAKL